MWILDSLRTLDRDTTCRVLFWLCVVLFAASLLCLFGVWCCLFGCAMWRGFWISTTLLLIAIHTQATEPHIYTECGVYTGIQNTNADMFLGVEYSDFDPHAHPSSTRWIHSSPKTCHSSETHINATTRGPVCLQSSPWMTPPRGASEACFNMDVYVPRGTLDKKTAYLSATPSKTPILLWLYGGGNLVGYSDMYPRLDVLAAKLQAIVLSPNTRVGPLGFATLPSAGIDSGNRGIGDGLSALEFFLSALAGPLGGDPENVIVMGQSSGGTNGIALLGSPRGRSLFQTLISLSGSPNITESSTDAASAFESLYLPATGCASSPHVRACLDAASPASLMAALPPSYSTDSPIPSSPSGQKWQGLVVVDGEVVVEPPISALAAGKADGMTLFLQSMAGETDPSSRAYDTLPASEFTSTVEAYLDSTGWGPRVGTTVAGLYADRAGETNGTARGMAESWWTDICVTCGNHRLAAAAAAAAPATRVYRSVVVTPPYYPFPQSKTLVSLLPFHTWDFPIASLGAWDYERVWNPKAPIYTPHPRDEELGSMLISVFSALTRGEPDLAPAMARLGFQESVQGKIICNGLTEKGAGKIPCPSGIDLCNALSGLGFGPQFWWVN